MDMAAIPPCRRILLAAQEGQKQEVRSLCLELSILPEGKLKRTNRATLGRALWLAALADHAVVADVLLRAGSYIDGGSTVGRMCAHVVKVLQLANGVQRCGVSCW